MHTSLSTNLGVDRLLEFIDTVPVPQQDIDFFNATAWTRPYLRDPNSAYRPVPFHSRYRKPGSSDGFFSRTIASSDTIPHCLLLLRKGSWDSNPDAPSSSEQKRPFACPSKPDLLLLLHVASGMSGFADTAHGGAMCALLDEALGLCVEVHRHTLFKDQKTKLYTAGLNVSFLSLVPAPSVVVIRAWLVRREGRKWFLRAQVADEGGRVLVETEALWMSERLTSTL